MIKKTLFSSRFITIPLISLLLLFVFSCNDEDSLPTHPNPEQEEFNLKYTKCKITAHILADVHLENANDGTQSDTTKYDGLNSKHWAGGWIDASDYNDYGGTFRGIYDAEGYSGTIVVIFKNEELIESLDWSGTYEGPNNTQTTLVHAEDIDISPHEPNVFMLTFANNLVDCASILTIDHTSSGKGLTYTWPNIHCDTKTWLSVRFEE